MIGAASETPIQAGLQIGHDDCWVDVFAIYTTLSAGLSQGKQETALPCGGNEFTVSQNGFHEKLPYCLRYC